MTAVCLLLAVAACAFAQQAPAPLRPPAVPLVTHDPYFSVWSGNTPLDNRETYTKLDWVVWTATLAESMEDFRAFITPVYRFVNETPDRIPLTDWYGTVDARQRGFQARSVVGGVYVKMIADPAMWKKWSGRAGR